MKIEHIIFLIHPCCYEGLDAETVRKDNLYLYGAVQLALGPFRWCRFRETFAK